MQNYVYDLFNDFMCCMYDNKLSKINFDDMMDLNDNFTNFFKKMNDIKNLCCNNEYYLYCDCEFNYIVFVDEWEKLRCYNIDEMYLTYFEKINNKINNMNDLLLYAIDIINRQNIVNEQKILICEN